MRENLPKEMDFQHEARNALRAEQDFVGVRTALYIRKCATSSPPTLGSRMRSAKVVDARKRVLITEYIRGGRVDDIEYLADHDIGRNKVSVDIFSRMVHINGWFHAVCFGITLPIERNLLTTS